MRLPKIFFLLLVSFSINAQDSLLKTRLKLFDIQAGFAIGYKSPFQSNLAAVSALTKHKEYVSENFTRGYSDSIGGAGFHEWFAPNLYVELGLNASFQFQNAKSEILQRIKPRIGIYYSRQTLMDYGIGYYKRYTVDSVRPPTTPAVAVDSIVAGQILYTYTSKRIFMEIGANFDLIVKRRFILYAGFLYGYGIGYDNQFYVKKYEEAFVNGSVSEDYNFISVKERFKEDVTTNSRLIIPIGIQHRFAVFHKFSMGFFGEMRPGISTLRTKNGTTTSGIFMSASGGLRFSFQYHK